jgi:hypothetical protein
MVAQVWKPGKEHSDTGNGFHVKVGSLPVACEDEAMLINLFSCYGGVLAATVRKRAGTWPDGERKKSWAIVSFSSLRAAEDAVTANTRPPALEVLDLQHLDEHRAHTSMGAMGVVLRKHLTKTAARACIGTIVSETAGASDVVGERCCAVRLYTDDRVLLVRRIGLEEMSFQDVEKVWQSEQVRESLNPQMLAVEEVRSESASMARVGLLRSATLAVLSAVKLRASSQQRHLQDTSSDEDRDATTSDTSDTEMNVPIHTESVPVSTTHVAADDLLEADAGSDVEDQDEFTDLLSEHPSEIAGQMSELEATLHANSELEPSLQHQLKSKSGQQQGPERPSRTGSTGLSPSLVPLRPALMRTVHTPGALTCH